MGGLEGRLAQHRRLDLQESQDRQGRGRSQLVDEVLSGSRFRAAQPALTGETAGRVELNLRLSYLHAIRESLVSGAEDAPIQVLEARLIRGGSPILHPDLPFAKTPPAQAGLLVFSSDHSVSPQAADRLMLAGTDDAWSELVLSQGLFIKVGESQRPFPSRSLVNALKIRNSLVAEAVNLHPTVDGFKAVVTLLQRFQLQDEIRALNLTEAEHSKLGFLSEVDHLSTETQLPRVSRQYSSVTDKSAYSLFHDGEVLMRYIGENRFVAACSTSKSKPFEVEPIVLSPTPEALLQTRRYVGLAVGDIVNGNGFRLFGEPEARARELFDNLHSGIEIFPTDGDPGFRIERAEPVPRVSGPRVAMQPRGWGQVYLESLKPEMVQPGQVFPADPLGRMYKAFVFSDYVICESTHTGNATYVISRLHWEKLRMWSRRDLALQRPAGFMQRVFHGRDEEGFRQHWQKEVYPYTQAGRRHSRVF